MRTTTNLSWGQKHWRRLDGLSLVMTFVIPISFAIFFFNRERPYDFHWITVLILCGYASIAPAVISLIWLSPLNKRYIREIHGENEILEGMIPYNIELNNFQNLYVENMKKNVKWVRPSVMHITPMIITQEETNEPIVISVGGLNFLSIYDIAHDKVYMVNTDISEKVMETINRGESGYWRTGVAFKIATGKKYSYVFTILPLEKN